MKSIAGFIFKLLYVIFIRYMFPEKVLQHAYGCDSLPAFSRYSYNGVPRKRFLVLHRKMMNKCKISRDEYTRAEWGSLSPSKEQFMRVVSIRERINKMYSFKPI